MAIESRDPDEVKTLAIRVSPELHANWALICRIDGLSHNEAGIKAVEAYIASRKADPEFRAKATANRAEAKRKAEEARQAALRQAEAEELAMAELFGDETSDDEASAEASTEAEGKTARGKKG